MSARLAAVEALLLTPFVGGCLFLIVCAVVFVARVDRRPARNPYMGPWADREPGELPCD